MRRRFITILLIACACMSAKAQTPYDSFSPETSRPMLGGAEIESPSDSVLCAVVADMQNQILLLVDISNGEVIAAAPITDEVLKWMSVDPLADKYPNISPYAYCEWNPIGFVDPDGRNPRTGVPGKEMNGVWTTAQNTTHIERTLSFTPIQLPKVEYFNRLASANPGTLQPTYTMEKYLQNIPEQDVALITNPAIQIAAVAVFWSGTAVIGSEIAPVVMNTATDISTYINASLYPAFESSVPLQVGAGAVEGVVKGVIPGTELTPNMYSSFEYQIGSEIGNTSVYIIKDLNCYIKNSIQMDHEGQ